MSHHKLERRLKIAQKLIMGVIILLVVNSIASMLQGVLGYLVGISVVVMIIVVNLLLSNRFELRNRYPILMILTGSLMVLIPVIELGIKIFEAGSVQWALFTSVAPVFIGSVLPIVSLVLVSYIIKTTIAQLQSEPG